MRRQYKTICTKGLIVVNIIVFLGLTLIGNTQDAIFMVEHGAMYEPYVVQGGEYYRLFTSQFLHFGIEHLLNNMVLLGALGWHVEEEIGHIKFLFIYLFAGVGGNLCSLLWNMFSQNTVISAGASGAVFGLMGALACILIKNKGKFGNLTGKGIIVLIVFSLYVGFSSSGVDNLAHIGGLLFGLLLTFLLYRSPKSKEIQHMI